MPPPGSGPGGSGIERRLPLPTTGNDPGLSILSPDAGILLAAHLRSAPGSGMPLPGDYPDRRLRAQPLEVFPLPAAGHHEPGSTIDAPGPLRARLMSEPGGPNVRTWPGQRGAHTGRPLPWPTGFRGSHSMMPPGGRAAGPPGPRLRAFDRGRRGSAEDGGDSLSPRAGRAATGSVVGRSLRFGCRPFAVSGGAKPCGPRLRRGAAGRQGGRRRASRAAQGAPATEPRPRSADHAARACRTATSPGTLS